jgi:predicted O-linked N-acetylglucosamine transferase (SPINDLY family)
MDSSQSFEVLFNSATTYANDGKYEDALRLYGEAYKLNKNSWELLLNVGIINDELSRHEIAIELYERVLQLNPDADLLNGNLLLAKMKICSWSKYAEHIKVLREGVIAGKCTSPFAMTALDDSPELQYLVAKTYSNTADPHRHNQPKFHIGGNSKIRIGYFSSDFHNHAITYLMSEFLSLHDRNKFEIFAFSFGPQFHDDGRKNITASVDHFFDVSQSSCDEIVNTARGLNIDIGIDLNGHTKNMRMEIFEKRVAPLQLNYLGYPGTMGVEFYDYILADKILIPADQAGYYSEKIIYLPHSYQANDSKRFQRIQNIDRNKLGVPDAEFIFCCFNNSYKITPFVFDSWMRILQRVPTSILWLREYDKTSNDNLLAEALKRGVNSDRIVFAKSLPLNEHLNRLAFADVVLDTRPYGAHTTASDALLVGVPVITLIGKSFASRVAASLLSALGMNELITNSEEEYETLAISLAQQPDKLASLKKKIFMNVKHGPLFKTNVLVTHVENAYIQILNRKKLNLHPENIYIA